MTEKDQEDLQRRAVFGTKTGYNVVLWAGQEPIGIEVTPTSVTSKPAGYEKAIELETGNILTLRGGTKVIPIVE